jgi:polysaccharide biosynthesis protein VpsM
MLGKWLFLFLIAIFLNPLNLYSSEVASHALIKNGLRENSVSDPEAAALRQMGAFKVKENAENFVIKLRNEGHETVLQEGVSGKKEKIYRVLVKKYGSSHQGDAEYAESGEYAPAEPPKPCGDYVLSALTSRESAKPSNADTSPEQKAPAGSPLPGEPVGVTKQRPSEEVFGRRGGFIHPFLAVTGYYTDNVFYSRNSKKSDFVTILSPGIWLTVPHVYEKLLNIETSNLTPGGFRLREYEPETFRRYQTYLFYNADLEFFSRHSSENTVNHKLEGLLQYNLRGGLSLALLDQFIVSHDDRGTGISTRLDKYKTNAAHLTATYEPFERFRFRVDYTNFLVDYNASRNDFRDRIDNGIAVYAFYKLKPKTSVFVEYDYVNIDYDKRVSWLDSREHHYFGGLQWDITAKSKGSVKAGYGVKDFVDRDLRDGNYFTMEAKIDYKFTAKTSLILTAARETNETNIAGTGYILTNRIGLEYLQKLTGKITGDIRLSYEEDDYRGNFFIDGEKKHLRDRYYSGAFAIQYKFREWLETDVGYLYTRRNSNVSDFDYISNIVFLRITGSL